METQSQPIWLRFARSMRRQGPGTTAVKLAALAADYWFDMRHRTDTCRFTELAGLTIESGNRERGALYSPTRVLSLRALFAWIGRVMPEGSVLVDFGCGKGRVMLVALECGFRRVRGVEFAHELCEAARKNFARFTRGRPATGTEFTVIEDDAACYEVKPDENVFFMFNPFDDVVLIPVLESIMASVRAHDRRILVAYHLPKYGRILEEDFHLCRLHDLNAWGHTISLYSNDPELGPTPSLP